jgi:hypothetical protein
MHPEVLQNNAAGKLVPYTAQHASLLLEVSGAVDAEVIGVLAVLLTHGGRARDSATPPTTAS